MARKHGFFEVKDEGVRNDAVEFGQAFLGERPKPLDAVEVDPAVGKAGGLVDPFVAKPSSFPAHRSP